MTDENNTMPERINAIRVITYSVPDIVSHIEAMRGEPEVTLEEVMDYIEETIEDDMRSPLSRHEVVYQDENGEEL